MVLWAIKSKHKKIENKQERDEKLQRQATIILFDK